MIPREVSTGRSRKGKGEPLQSHFSLRTALITIANTVWTGVAAIETLDSRDLFLLYRLGQQDSTPERETNLQPGT